MYNVSNIFTQIDGRLDAAVQGILERKETAIESFAAVIKDVPLIHAIPQMTSLFQAKLDDDVYDQLKHALHTSIPDTADRINDTVLSNLALATAYRAGNNYDLEQYTVRELEEDAYSYMQGRGIHGFVALADDMDVLAEEQQRHLTSLLIDDITRFTAFPKPSNVRADEYYALLKKFPFELMEDNAEVMCRNKLFPHLMPEMKVVVFTSAVEKNNVLIAEAQSENKPLPTLSDPTLLRYAQSQDELKALLDEKGVRGLLGVPRPSGPDNQSASVQPK